MGFNIINKDSWARKETFEHFFYNAKCTYSLTVNVDITDLYNLIKANEFRLYPTFTWIVSKAINNHQEFRHIKKINKSVCKSILYQTSLARVPNSLL